MHHISFHLVQESIEPIVQNVCKSNICFVVSEFTYAALISSKLWIFSEFCVSMVCHIFINYCVSMVCHIFANYYHM